MWQRQNDHSRDDFEQGKGAVHFCGLVVLFIGACAAEPNNSATPTPSPNDAIVNVAADTTAAAQDVDAGGGALLGAIVHERPLQKGPSWQPVGTFKVQSKGITEQVTVKVPDGVRYVAIRAQTNQSDAEDPACVRLSDVKTANGEVWVPTATDARNNGVCSGCDQRVANARGYGLYVFPNDGGELESVGSLSFKVHLRHCMTDLLLPSGALGSQVSEITVDVATEPAWPANQPARLDLLLALGTSDALSGEPLLTFIGSVEEHMRSLLTPVGVDLRVIAWVRADLKQHGLEEGVDVSADTVHELDPVQTAVDVAAEKVLGERLAGGSVRDFRLPILMLVPCIEERNIVQSKSYVLAGKSLRIPGGGRVGSYASMILVSTVCEMGSADNSSIQRIGSIAVHELGHHLGLYHSDGVHGLPASATATDVMRSNLAIGRQWDLGFTPKQAVVMRAHPDIYSN